MLRLRAGASGEPWPRKGLKQIASRTPPKPIQSNSNEPQNGHGTATPQPEGGRVGAELETIVYC